MVLTLMSVINGMTNSTYTENHAPLPPSNLKMELLEYPYGLNTKDPAFSWVVNDVDKNEMQTEYRIVFSNTNADVINKKYFLNTGWQKSNNSTYVKVDGLKEILDDNALYYWQVQTKDKYGAESPLSKSQAFTTGVAGKWENVNGIWGIMEDSNSYAEWTDYVLEANVNIKENALGIIFRSLDKKHGYMMQFKAVDNLLCPHVMNGSWVQTGTIQLANKGIHLALNTPFKVKIKIVGNNVKTYIDTTNQGTQYKLIDDRELSQNYGKGSIGFRTGRTESGTVDDIKVTKIDSNGNEGDILYSDNFTNETDKFSGCTVKNGELNIPKAQLDGSVLSSGKGKSNFVFLRSEYKIDNYANVEKAILSVTAKSPENTRQYVYNMYMNGKFIGVGPTRLGVNSLYYNTYDVTNLLRDGENALGTINYTQDEKSFLCQLTLFYKDGKSKVVVNSGRDQSVWKSLNGTDVFGDNGINIGTAYYYVNAENINSNLFPYGWDKPGFDDAKWDPVVDRGPIDKDLELCPYPSDNISRYLIDPAIIESKGDGIYWIDLGKEIIGGLHLKINSPSMKQITLYYGEEGNRKTGDVQWKMNTGNQYCEHWTLKKGEQIIENIGMKAFRYVRLENCPAELNTQNIKGLALRQEFSDNESSFASSDKMLNEIYDTMKYTIKATNQDLMVDSQSRERGAYEGDTLINMNSSYAFEDDYTLPRFSLEYLNTHSTWPAEYNLFSIEMQWLDYLYTGNIDSLRRNYDILKEKLFDEYFDSSVGLMGKPNLSYLVDWPNTERDGYKFSEAYFNTVFNAVAVGAYNDMSNIASVLLKEKDALYYKTRSNMIKDNMIKKLYSQKEGAFRDGLTKTGEPIEHYSQHATAFSLAYNIYSNSQMIECLTNYIKNQKVIKMSVYGAFFLLKGLYNVDAGDVADMFMTDTNEKLGARTWAYMIRNLGATITSEAWNEENKKNMTYSHPWGSAPGSQIPQGVFGIKPTSPGFNTFQVKFQPGNIKNASIKIPSIKGSITAAYHIDSASNLIDTNINVPVNANAKVYLPVKGSKNNYLMVDGKEILADRKGNYLAVKLGSGEHTVTEVAPMTAPNEITLSHSTLSLKIGAAQKLVATITPSNVVDKTVTWSSSNANIAVVNESGQVTAKSAGTATITAETWNGKTATCTVTVTKADHDNGNDENENKSSKPVVPSTPAPTTTYVSDTTHDLAVNSTYQFKITSTNGKPPVFVIGTPGVFEIEAVKQSGNDYFFELKAIGIPGDKAGIYINNGPRLLVATVGSNPNYVKLDTGKQLSVRAGKTYQFRVTAAKRPTFVCGTGLTFRVAFAGSKGNDYFFKVTATGKVGDRAGFYVNSEKVPRTIGTIIS